MVLEMKDKMGKLCKILYADRAEMADFCLCEVGYCPSCGNLFSPVDRYDIIECPVCHSKIYGRAIAIDNGFLVEKEDILQ